MAARHFEAIVLAILLFMVSMALASGELFAQSAGPTTFDTRPVGIARMVTQGLAKTVNENLFKFPTTYDWTTIGALVLLGMILAVVASSLTALPASSEKPMSVLRYE